MFNKGLNREYSTKPQYEKMNGAINMAIGRLVRSAIKYGPIAYPIIRKVMNNRKKNNANNENDARNRSDSRKSR